MFSKNNDKTISYVAFAFVYGYNENEMTVTNAELNILATGYVTKQSEDSKDDSSVSAGNESDDDTEVDNYVDYEVLSESVDKTKPFMQTSSEYDSTGNYVTSETNEQGSTTHYVYDVNGNVTSITDADDNVTSYAYDSSGNLTSVKNGDSENSYTYSGLGSVSKITHNGFSYSFNYDVFYNLVSTRIGNVAITSNTYDSNGNLTKTAYANGDYLEYAYDNYGNISVITGETGKIAEMIYNKQGLVTKAVDYSSGETSYYYYTFDGSLESEYRTSSDGSLTHYIITDSNGNTVEKTSVNGQTMTITTGSDDDGKSFVNNDGVINETSTDDLGRVSTVTTKQNKSDTVFTKQYSYYHGSESNATTNMVGGISYKLSSDKVLDYGYNYTDTGNVENVYENGKKVAVYTYDELNQLMWYADTRTGRYIRIVYDNYGNIQKMESYSLGTNWAPVKLLETRTYSYGDTNWKDKLTEFDGDSITYDANGNPLTYRDGMSFEWENGRILKKINTSDKAIQMSYDSNGMRTQKSVDGVKTNYYYDSNKNLIALVKGNDTLLFYYDSDGSATSFSYNGTMYFYVKNLQGDVIRIIDLAGTEVASYVYDSWGNIKDTKGDTTVRELNPIRYRGYVYDTETSLYYLQSRYYDPFTGRFLNADDTAFVGTTGTVLSGNIFAYCENNPISNADESGYIAANVIGAVIGGIVGAVGGYFLTNWLADKLNLHGWKRNVFVWGLSAVIGAAAAVIGYFIGPYVAKIAVKLGQYVASLIRKGKIVFRKLSSKVKSSVRSLLKQTCCFVAGTQIDTPYGSENIENISIGDSVYAKNPDTGEIGVKKVTNVFVRQTSELCHIVTNTEEIIATNEHPFWVVDKGWVSASDLFVGDELYSESENCIYVVDVYTEILSEPVSVYNFEVEDWHTYFVGTSNILVHNKCGLTKISDSYLKKKGLNAHKIKYDVLGKKAQISRYNLYYDKNTKAIFILKNGAKADAKIATGYFLK